MDEDYDSNTEVKSNYDEDDIDNLEDFLFSDSENDKDNEDDDDEKDSDDETNKSYKNIEDDDEDNVTNIDMNDDIIEDLDENIEYNSEDNIDKDNKYSELDLIKLDKIKNKPNVEKLSEMFLKTMILTTNGAKMINSLSKDDLSNGDWINDVHNTAAYSLACILTNTTPLVVFQGDNEKRVKINFNDNKWLIILSKKLINDGLGFRLFNCKILEELCPNILHNNNIYNNNEININNELEDLHKLKNYMIKTIKKK